MIKKIYTLIAAGLFSTFSFAQNKMEVQEKSANIGGGNHNAFAIVIFEADKKLVEKDWKKELKGMGAKVKAGKEIFGDDAQLGAMGENSFDIYATTKELDEGVELTVAVDLGGAYLTSGAHANQAKIIKDLMHRFAVSTAKEAIREMVQEEEKILKSFEKEQDELVKDKDKLEKSITDNENLIEQAKKDIEQAKKDIETNEKNQDSKKQEIEKQKQVVASTQAKEAAVE